MLSGNLFDGQILSILPAWHLLHAPLVSQRPPTRYAGLTLPNGEIARNAQDDHTQHQQEGEQ